MWGGEEGFVSMDHLCTVRLTFLTDHIALRFLFGALSPTGEDISRQRALHSYNGLGPSLFLHYATIVL